MAQRPTADFNIDPNITSGTDLANILNRFQDAIDSGNSGASRPAYLDAGGLWVREGDPMRLYLYDGTTDRELYNTTDGLVGASQWKDNGNDIYYSDGNVGIGTDSPSEKLTLWGDGSATSLYVYDGAGSTAGRFTASGDSVDISARGSANSKFTVTTGAGSGNTALTIDASGNVGIGMTPAVVTAKEQLETWKSQFDARLKAEPKADKKAVTLEITDDAFEVLPSEDKLAEWMETRGAGDKLQVGGNISASGTVDAGAVGSSSAGWTAQLKNGNELDFSRGSLNYIRANGSNGGLVFETNGNEALRINNNQTAVFSSTVDAAGFTVNGSPLTRVSDLIETLSTLRTATKDETTLEGLRDAIGDAVGGLIQKFEAIQAEAEKAHEEAQKAATMDIEE